MRYALKERPVKGTTASVNIVNAEANELEVKKLDGFSAFHNFCFQYDGVQVWNRWWKVDSIWKMAKHTTRSHATESRRRARILSCKLKSGGEGTGGRCQRS